MPSRDFPPSQVPNLDVRPVTNQRERAEALDRVQAGKRRLRDALERLESEACDLDTIAIAARQSLLRVASDLRKELASPRPCNEPVYEAQRNAIATASVGMEHELIAVGPLMSGSGACHFRTAIERTLHAMLRLDAAFDEAELQFCLGLRPSR